MDDLVTQITNILTKMGVTPGTGGTIVSVTFPAGSPIAKLGPQTYELDYNHALTFANSVYNLLHLPVKAYSKATPGAIYLDLKSSEPPEINPLTGKKLLPSETLKHALRVDEEYFGGSGLPGYIKLGTKPDHLFGLYSQIWDYLMGYMGNETRSTGGILDRGPVNLHMSKERLQKALSEMFQNDYLRKGDPAWGHRQNPAVFQVQEDKRGDLTITVPDEPSKSVFLQPEDDKQLIFEILRGDEPDDLSNGYKIEIPANEPRASVLQEIWANGEVFQTQLATRDIVKSLRQSMAEERQAVIAYKERAEFAEVHGNTKVAELYGYIRDEEKQHWDEFQKLEQELTGI